ncbi:MAG: ribose-phosphate pyrophosphokinase [Oscillospiraceae bacterium]|jgi:ribose-phosphate pyrophosphokinase|nr:ribose-phosphate pyrophosphokinase [Oscillospiraceae bacterium]
MIINGNPVKIFAANSNRQLAADIAANVGQPLGDVTVGHFSDGEIAVSFGESVRGSDVFVVQSTSAPVNDHLMELLIMTDALRRASAYRITAVMPYYGYARQDRKAKARDAISAKLVANMLAAAGADRVLTMDLHSPQIQGFFDIPLDHLTGVNILAPYFRERFIGELDEFVTVSPDLGSVTRARNFANLLGIPLAIVDKRRQHANVSEVMNIIGEVRGRRVIILDDMVDTGGSLCNAAAALVQKGGATEVYACATHAVLSGNAVERIQQSHIKEMVFLNTIALPDDKKIDKIKVISVADVFGQAVYRIAAEKPVSPLFM